MVYNRAEKKKKKKRAGEVEIREILGECERTKAVTRNNLKEFSNLLLYKHGIISSTSQNWVLRHSNSDLFIGKDPGVLKVTFISRGNNRRILNEASLIGANFPIYDFFKSFL